MSCSKYRDLFDDYARGWLEPSLIQEVDEHLTICDECSGEFESHSNLLSILELEPKLNIESDELRNFVPEVWSKIENRKMIAPKSWLFKFIPSMAMALFLMIFVIQPPSNITIYNYDYQSTTDTYSDSEYYSLIVNTLSEKDVEELSQYENEQLYKSQYYNYNYSDYTDWLSDDELELFESKLNKIFKITG
jgi:hypothetical protein